LVPIAVKFYILRGGPMKTRSIPTLVALLIIGLTTFGQSQEDASNPKVAGGVSQHWAEEENFSTLVKNSPLVVKGKVTHIQAMKYPPKRENSVSTYSDIEITDLYKDTLGTNAKTITVHQLGGTLDGLVIHNSQNPTFKIGEEYILILRSCDREGKLLWCVAQNKGRFHLVDGRAYQKHKPEDDQPGLTVPGWNEHLKTYGYPTDIPEKELVSKIQDLERSTPK
jgi:hypothetical protein